ncbi:MAG TPA: FAD:protein FMN transferase [Acidimicrobiales bacterium]|nr:FAD:protein FMN transferase [Acidimicrobiales bacterium]
MRSVRRVEQVMGTVFSFDVRVEGMAADQIHVALTRAGAGLRRADAVFSTWKPDSPMSRLRRGEITLGEAPAEVAAVLGLCHTARALSGGWFDPWAMPGGVDPTGLVKGWAAAQAAAGLRHAGVDAGMVNAGGDVVTFGSPEPGRPWRVGVRDPWDAHRIVAVVEGPAAVATSGCYERGQHVLDPRTGEPSAAVASATVVGADLALADALATGLLAAGEAGVDAVVAAGYQALLVLPDRRLSATPAFPGVCAAAA